MAQTTEPTQAVAGDAVTWTRSVADHTPDGGSTLVYTWVREGAIRQASGVPTADNLAWDLTLPTDLGPGVWYWQAQATLSGARTTVDDGRLVVTPDFSDEATGHDARTAEQRWLDTLLASRQRYIDRPSMVLTSTDSAGSRSRTFRSLDEIDAAIRAARADIARYQRRTGTRTGQVHVRLP